MAEIIWVAVDVVVASGGEKVVAGGSASAVGFKSQYRWCGLVSWLQPVAHMGVFEVARLVPRLLLPSLVVLRRLTVKPKSHHVYFVRSTASIVKHVFILMLYCTPYDTMNGGLGSRMRKIDAQLNTVIWAHPTGMRLP